MEFKKYKSLEPAYNMRMISNVVSKHPDLEKERFILTEKLDGANIQITFTPFEDMIVGKRTSFVSPDTPFFKLWETLDKYKEELNILQKYSNDANSTFTFYGELYGKGINNRVDYGEEQYIAFFDVAYHDDGCDEPVCGSPASALSRLELLCIAHMYVPIIVVVDGVSAALKHNEEFDSLVLGKEDNKAEGFVLRPYNRTYRMGNNNFVIKKKARSFAEKEQKKSKVKSLHKYDTDLLELRNNFESLINVNRLHSAISKEGEFNSPSQIGTFISLMIKDAREEFHKENEITVSDKDLKYIYGAAGRKAADVCRSYLGGE